MISGACGLERGLLPLPVDCLNRGLSAPEGKVPLPLTPLTKAESAPVVAAPLAERAVRAGMFFRVNSLLIHTPHGAWIFRQVHGT